MILPKSRDPRLVTIRRGGTLTDSDHHLLALWAASCAEHVLPFFESARPEDPRPRQAIEQARAWARGEVTMTQARTAAGHAMGAARDLRGAARYAAYAAGQAAAVAHVAAHELGAAAYAIRAARAAAPPGSRSAITGEPPRPAWGPPASGVPARAVVDRHAGARITSLPHPRGMAEAPLSNQTRTSRGGSASAGRRARVRGSPPGAGRAATGTRADPPCGPPPPGQQRARP